MDKLLRTLIENEEISLAAIDSTEMVRHAQIIHNMTPAAARIFGRVITAMTYMAGWLKDEKGELSVSLKHKGESGEICVSGDGALHMRGYVFNPLAESEEIGAGYITVVRDDNYARPFVGTCELVGKDTDEIFEYYYRVSEQLPTYLKTDVEFDEHGLCRTAGGIFLQPMPGASEKSIQFAENATHEIQNIGKIWKDRGMEPFLKEYFNVEKTEERTVEYHCRCSREYIAGVLSSMGEAELRDIIAKEGKINVHCHYCNSDYDFYDKDVDEMFSVKKTTSGIED